MALSDNADPEPASRTPQDRAEATPPKSSRKALAATFLVLTLVATVAAAGGLVWQIRLMSIPDSGVLTAPEAYPPGEPAEVLAATDADAPVPDLSEVMPELLADPRLDGDLSVSFADAVTGEALYEREEATPLTPASSMKLVTAVAAYEQLGADYRIPTTVVEGPDEDTVVLVAGGDITLTDDGEGYYGTGASLTELAEAVVEARGGEAPKRVLLDTSVFTDAELAKGVDGDDLPYTARMAPIMINGGRVDGTQEYYSFSHDPAQLALDRFAELVGADESGSGTAEDGAAELGRVYSEPVAGLVDSMVLASDNVLADALALQTALVAEGEMTWDALGRAHRSTLEGFGVDTAELVFEDGSGLSVRNRMTAEAFTGMLAGATDSAASTVFESMPVAAYSGTLDDRFDTAEEGAGVVRAKTGTLSGVSSLTGSVTTADGRLLVFSLISNGHSAAHGVQRAMDEVSAAIGQCGC